MEGPEESEAGLDMIAEVCWEPAYLLVSICRDGKMQEGEEVAGRKRTRLDRQFRRGGGGGLGGRLPLSKFRFCEGD